MTSTFAVIYTRVSKFEAGQRSPEDQEAACRELCARHGWVVREVYAEAPGTSAYHEWVQRPELDRLLADLQPGTVVVAWAVDRLTRRGMEQAGAVLRVLEEAGAVLVTVSDGVDSRRDDAELHMGIRAILARSESRNTSLRSRRGIARRRAEGQWLWNRAPYGLRVEDRRLVRDPETYPIARRIADELLAGESAYAVTKRLNEAGIPGPTGGTWNVGSVVRIATNPAWAGVAIVRKRLRGGRYFYRPVILGEESDDVSQHKPPTSVGEGVISLAEHRRIVAMMDSRTRSKGRKRSDARFAQSGRRVSKTLLAPFARCGRVGDDGEMCGSRVVGSGKDPSGGAASYVCLAATSRARAGDTCRGMYMSVSYADREVGERFITRVSSCEPDDPLMAVVAERWTAHEQPEAVAARLAAEKAVEDVRGAIARIDTAYEEGIVDLATYRDRRATWVERLRAAQEELRRLPKPAADISPLMDAEVLRAAWESAPLARRRMLLSLAVDSVVLRPAARRGEPWNPERVEVIWLDHTITDQ